MALSVCGKTHSVNRSRTLRVEFGISENPYGICRRRSRMTQKDAIKLPQSNGGSAGVKDSLWASACVAVA